MKPTFATGICVRASLCHDRYRLHLYKRKDNVETQHAMSKALGEKEVLRRLSLLEMIASVFATNIHIGWDDEER